MKARWRTAAVVWLAGAAIAADGHASELAIERVAATSQGYVYVDYRLDQPFEGKARDAIRSGLPSTLTFTFEVWRKRAGWWDPLEETREFSVRVLRDLLNDQYIAATAEEVRRFSDLDSLTEAVCGHRREYLRVLKPTKSYYVAISANLAPLSVEDLRELETWLSGSLRSGEESSPGRVAGISGTMVGLLMSVTGFGDETSAVRSASFVPAQVPRATTPVGESLPPRTAGGGAPAAADSAPKSGSRPED